MNLCKCNNIIVECETKLGLHDLHILHPGLRH